MSSQEKKNFLMRYRDCEREIVRLEEEIARWQSRAERITAGYSPAPGAHGETRDRIQEAVCEMAELRGELRWVRSGFACCWNTAISTG